MSREDVLLRSFRVSGDAAAMEALVAATRPRLIGVARRIGAPQDAEDSVQAAYHALLRRPPPESTVVGWLVTAVVRIAYRRKASARRDATLAARLARSRDDASDPSSSERDEMRALVRREVHLLPARYRDAVVLHHLEELPVADVARLLDVPEATVKTRVRRGRLLLRARLATAFAGAFLVVPSKLEAWAAPWAGTLGGAIVKGKLAVGLLLGGALLGVGTCAVIRFGEDADPGARSGDAAPGTASDADPVRGAGRTRSARGRAAAPLDPSAPGDAERTVPPDPEEARLRVRVEPGTPSASFATGGGEPGARNLVVKRISGKVVDLATGEPVPGARVLLANFDEERSDVPSGSWGGTSAEDGSFTVGPNDGDAERRTLRVDVRVTAPGYRMATVPAEEGVVVRLEQRRGPHARGRIAGIVTDEKDRPFTGPVHIEGLDGAGDWFGMWMVAGADGGFALEGVPAGPWRLWFGGGKPAEVTVPEGTDVRVHLRGKSADAYGRLDLRATREVRVSGLPREAGLHVRLRFTGSAKSFFRAPVADGRAAFPAVPLAEWSVELERDERDEALRILDVVAGEGPIQLDVSGPPR